MATGRCLFALDGRRPLTPDIDGLWSNKVLAKHVAPVDAVTWVAENGIRYLLPEIVLVYKARRRASEG